MIIGIGMDLVEIARVQKAYQRTSTSFVKRVLTNREIEQIEDLQTEKRRIEWLSGRIAAKEAFSKAIGQGFGNGMKFHDIEVIPDTFGKPVFILSERIQTSFQAKIKFHLTITHTEHHASAFVIAEENILTENRELEYLH